MQTQFAALCDRVHDGLAFCEAAGTSVIVLVGATTTEVQSHERNEQGCDGGEEQAQAPVDLTDQTPRFVDRDHRDGEQNPIVLEQSPFGAQRLYDARYERIGKPRQFRATTHFCGTAKQLRRAQELRRQCV
jgi:hypothetical protein